MEINKKNMVLVAEKLNEPVNTLILAKCFAELEKVRVNKYVLPIFKKYNFKNPKTGEFLKSDNDLYLSEEVEKCKEYYAECDKAHRANGFDGLKDHCPYLVAKELEMQAEGALVKESEQFFTVTKSQLLCHGMKKYYRFLDLLVGVVVSGPNYKKVKLPKQV